VLYNVQVERVPKCSSQVVGGFVFANIDRLFAKRKGGFCIALYVRDKPKVGIGFAWITLNVFKVDVVK
jgi:hypothetical protein